MFGLEKIADLFDDTYHSNMKFYRNEAQNAVDEVYQKHGEGARFYAAAATAAAGDAILNLTQGVASGFLDTLRVGEGSKKGGWGYAQDALRVVSVAGGVLKVAKVASATLKIGGPMSCAVSSGAKAATLSGNMKTVQANFNTIAQTFGGAKKVSDAGFRGVASMESAFAAVKTSGVRLTTYAAKGLDDVVALTKEARGPVMFGFHHSGGGHIMVAFRNLLGQVRFADQTGQLLTQAQVAAHLKTLSPAMALIQESMVVHALKAATVGQVASTPSVTDMLTAPLHPIAPEIMEKLRVLSYKAAGKPLTAPGR